MQSTKDQAVGAQEMKKFFTRNLAPEEPGLMRVGQIVAVASGKGGVAKSVSTMLLARHLADEGYRIGVMDADILGPSLPLLAGIEHQALEVVGEDSVMPHLCCGIKLASPGMIQSSPEATIMRGPVASRMISQWLQAVVWGELDYLLIDYPPGTGDIPLTLAQELNMAALLVTTPHGLAHREAEKTLQMFHSLHLPVVGWIETMSYFETPEGKRYEIFGRRGGVLWQQSYGVPQLASIPLDGELSTRAEEGRLLHSPWPSAACRAYKKAAQKLTGELSQLQRLEGQGGLPSFSLTWSKT